MKRRETEKLLCRGVKEPVASLNVLIEPVYYKHNILYNQTVTVFMELLDLDKLTGAIEMCETSETTLKLKVQMRLITR